MREWPVPAPSAQVTHAIKHKRLIAVTFALEDVSNCSCLRLSRLNTFGVPGCCYGIGRFYEGECFAMDVWL